MNAKEFHRVLVPGLGASRWPGPVVWALALLLVLGLTGCGKSPEEKKVDAEVAKAKLEAETTGRLVVKSNRVNTTIEATRLPATGEAASAAVKGTDEGAAEHALAALPPGKYAVTARSEGWPDVRAEATVEVGRTTEVAINFKSGSLRLDSDPTGATVRRGTAVLGKTPLVIPQLPAGECQLSLEYPTWPVLPFKTTISENGEIAESVRLPHGKLTIDSSPPGATVLLGGKAVGQTPLTLERVPAGTKKLTLQAKDFPNLETSVLVEDRGEAKIRPILATGYPVLDPENLLRAVWVPDNPNRLSPPVDGTTGPAQPKNGIIKNLNRKRLYEGWLRKRYCYTAVVKAYDPKSNQVEFVEETGDLSKYRILAKLSIEASGDPELAAQLAKGATFALYGRLSAVEEPRWPSKVITFELSAAEPLR
jgi:hypothetical protein